MIIAGLMSGSSLDGLDIALCDFDYVNDELKWDLLDAHTIPLPSDLKAKLSIARTLTAPQLAQLDSEFAKFSADQIVALSLQQQRKIAYIASHGHTVYHTPQNGYSVQIGHGGIIAALSGIPCIADFRMNDIALGGQGAPIVPIAEQVLFPDIKYFLNLGGIANISIHDEQVIAYDVCPCNQILNLLAQKIGLDYDRNGAIASSGKIDQGLLNAWSNLPYFKIEHPKSLDNSWVMDTFYSILASRHIDTKDALATMIEVITRQIINALEKNSMPKKNNDAQLMITGGGAFNTFLMQQIEINLPEHMSIKTIDIKMVEAKEAILMALMGFLRIKQMVNTIPTATGAKHGTCAGAVYMP